MVQSSDDAIISAGLDGRVLTWNAAAERMYGYAEAEAVGRPVVEFIAASHRYVFERDLGELRRGQRVSPYRAKGRRKDGSDFEVSLSVGPIKDDSGAIVGSAAIIRDVSELGRVCAELEQSRRFLQSVIENIPAGVIVKEMPSGRHILCNKVAAEIIGRPVEEILGKTNHDLYPKDEADYFTRKDFEAVSSGLVDVPQEPLTSAGGGRLLHARKMPVRNAQGVATHVVLVAEEITERKRVEKLKDEVLAMASHELKNPLTALAGIVGTLVDITQVTPRDREMLDLAYRTVQRMARMLSDYLDIERIESGSLELTRERVDLAAVAREAVRSMEAYAARNGIGFELWIEAGPWTVLGDADRLMQVIMNLLSNAGKFTTPGSSVEVGVESPPGRVRVRVTDRGPGVPEDLRGRIFERFAQSKVPGAREKGSGLGLSISRAIVERLGGRMSFTSRPGETTFSFELPAAARPPRP